MYDYAELTRVLPELSEYAIDGKLNYSNSKAIRLLNRALLLKEFNLKVNLPEGYLCPTVPNRTGYIKQIESILYEVLKVSKTETITGIDIGTGTSCIYPLIGCARNENWNFIASETDNEAIEYAQSNVEMNPDMINRVRIVKNPHFSRIFPDELVNVLDRETFKFIVCNPPFYANSTDLESRRAFKRHKPISGQWEMTQEELGTELGGEVGFIKKMIQESIDLKEKNIKLFSCMLGMKESLNQLLNHLSNYKSIQYFAFELLQIKHTCRYLLFWSDFELPKDSNHRLKINAKNRRLQIIEIKSEELINFNLENFIKETNLRYGEESNDPLCITITHNKWSRKYRRAPATAPPLSCPVKITVEQLENNLILCPDEEADWETFLGFVNHLRK